MKSTRKTLGRVLALALVVIMALTAAIPAFAANENPNKENLKITIHNNTGLPQLTKDSFDVYQLFSGSPNREKDPVDPEWDANQWNNWTLADIEWGLSVYKTEMQGDPAEEKVVYDHREEIINGLKALTKTENAWAFGEGEENPFASVETAEDVARVLVGKDNDFMQGFAKWLLDGKHVVSLGLEGVVDEHGTPDDYSDDTLTYTVPETGYYIFAEKLTDDAKAVSEYIIAVMGDQDIDLKASVPDVDKEIVGSANTNKGDVDGVGDVVTFKLTGTLPKNYGDFHTYYYEFVDTLSKGLTLDAESFEVTVKVGTSTYTINPSEYTVTHSTVEETGATLISVKFEDLKGKPGLDGVKQGLAYTKKDGAAETGYVSLDSLSEIYVTYTATVNEDAVIGAAGNPNDVHLVYSNDPNHDSHGETIEKRVYVYAFGIDVVKLASDTKKGLEGAGFTLKNGEGKYALFDEKKDDEGNVIGRVLKEWVEPDSVEKMISDYENAVKNYENASSEEKEAAKKEVDTLYNALKSYLLVSDKDGNLPDVYGLDEDTYTLTEVVTPAGYNTMDDFTFSIEAEIDSEGKLLSVTYTHGEEKIVYKPSYEDGEIVGDDDGAIEKDLKARFTSGLLAEELENEKAPLLPFTGGIGTVIFYVVGGLMIVGAAAYLFISIRRRGAEDSSAE